MGQALPWVAVGLAALILAYAGVRGRSGSGGLPPGAGAVLGAAIGVVLCGVLLALPTGAPWSKGQAFVPSLLMGGVAALAGTLLGNRARYGDDFAAQALASAARLAAPVLAFGVAAGLYGMFHDRFQSLLAGVALGYLSAGLILAGGFTLGVRDGEAHGEAATQSTLLAMAVAGSVYMGALHHSATGARDWLPLPLLLAATFAASHVVRAALGAAGAGGVAILVLPAAAISWLIGHKLGGTPAFFNAVLISLAAYGVVAWLAQTEGRDESGTGFRPDLGLLAALIVIGAGTLAFREGQGGSGPGLHGYGLAVGAMCGAAWLGLAAGQALLTGAVGLGVLLVQFRMFAEVNDYNRGFQPDFLYFYLALVVGALVPALLSGLLLLGRGAGSTSQGGIVRVGAAGLAALVLPGAVWVLVGARPQAALLVGLAIGAAFLLTRAADPGADRLNLALLLSLAVGWSAIQFTSLLQPIAELKRGQRVSILVAVGAAILIGIAFAAALDRRGRPTEEAPAAG